MARASTWVLALDHPGQGKLGRKREHARGKLGHAHPPDGVRVVRMTRVPAEKDTIAEIPRECDPVESPSERDLAQIIAAAYAEEAAEGSALH